jgi:hypothetical protein
MSAYTEKRWVWSGSGSSIGTSFTAVDLSHPDDILEYYLEQIVMEFSSIVTMATFDWYLATDSGGTHPITPLTSGAAVSDMMGSTKGYSKIVATGRKADSRGNGLYLIIKGDAGTFTVNAYIEGMRL